MLAWPRTLWQNAKKRRKERLSVSVSSGCGLDFHKRCAFLLPNDCSRIRRQVSTSFSLFPPRRPRTHSLSSQAGGSLEEVTSVPASSLLCCFSFFPAPVCVSAHLNRFKLPPPCRSACPSRRPGRRRGTSRPSGSGTRAGLRSPTPSTSTATPNPQCASTATGCSKGSSGRGCSAQVQVQGQEEDGSLDS